MMWNSEIAVENNNCLAVSDAECSLTSDSTSTRHSECSRHNGVYCRWQMLRLTGFVSVSVVFVL